MSTLKDWLTKKVLDSPHAALLQGETPRIAGAGEAVLIAAGPAPEKVVYVATRHDGATVRVGFAARDRWANEEIEDAVESNGGTMTEFIEDEMEADDLVYKVQHFHEAGWFHFASDIPKDAAFFNGEEGRELVWYYLDGYARAVLPVVMPKAE